MKKFYSFLTLTFALVLCATTVFSQPITVSSYEISSDAGANGGTLEVSYGGWDLTQFSNDLQFYDADGITPVDRGVYSWLLNSVYFMSGNPYELYWGYDNNPGIARTAYLRVVLRDSWDFVIDSSDLITISQAGAACPAPDHFALTEGSITSKGATFTWTGYSDN